MAGRKRVVIVGATSGIAIGCARVWAKRAPVDITLVGRSGTRLEAVATDLKVRYPGSDIATAVVDFLNVDEVLTLVRQIYHSGLVDMVLIAQGVMFEQKECQRKPHLSLKTLEVNAISPIVFAEAFALEMEKANHGTLGVIGSVAGDRGRKSNYTYGASKGLIAVFVQGLQHRFHGTAVRAVLIKPGPTATPMTAHLVNGPASLASVETVALQIVDGLEAAKPIIYAPRKWRYIMTVLKLLPAIIFNRLDI